MTHHSIQVYSESLIWPLITLLLLSAAAAASLRVRLDMMTEFHRQVRLHQSHTNVQWSGRGLKTAWLGSWARTLSLAVIKVQAVHFWQQSLWQWLWLRLPYFAVDWHIMTLPEPWLCNLLERVIACSLSLQVGQLECLTHKQLHAFILHG